MKWGLGYDNERSAPRRKAIRAEEIAVCCTVSADREPRAGGARDHDCLMSTPHRKVQPLSPGVLMVCMDNDG